jgi:hypothetical protein
VLAASDAKRASKFVRETVAYYCFYVSACVLLFAAMSGQLLKSLAQTLFPIKVKSRPPDSLVMAAGNFYHVQSANQGNHICFFNIDLVVRRATQLEQLDWVN